MTFLLFFDFGFDLFDLDFDLRDFYVLGERRCLGVSISDLVGIDDTDVLVIGCETVGVYRLRLREV